MATKAEKIPALDPTTPGIYALILKTAEELRASRGVALRAQRQALAEKQIVALKQQQRLEELAEKRYEAFSREHLSKSMLQDRFGRIQLGADAPDAPHDDVHFSIPSFISLPGADIDSDQRGGFLLGHE